MSRPRIPDLRRAHVTLPRRQYDEVQTRALSMGLSTSEYVRRLIDQEFDRNPRDQNKGDESCVAGSSCTES